MASKIFLALTLEESIKRACINRREGTRMCHHTQSCQGSCTCGIIMEEFSPCLPRCRNVGVRDWETCLVWNPSTLTSWFWQFKVLGICPRLCKVRQTMKTGPLRTSVWLWQPSYSKVFYPWGYPQVSPHSPTLISSQILKPLELTVPAKWPYCLPVCESLQFPACGQIQFLQQLNLPPRSPSGLESPRCCRLSLGL